MPLKKKCRFKGLLRQKEKKGEESKANTLLTWVKESLSCILFSRGCSHSPNRNGAQRRLLGTFVPGAQGQPGSPGMGRKYTPLPVAHGMEERLHDTGCSSRSATRRRLCPASVSAKPFGQTRPGGAPELLSTRMCPPPFQLPSPAVTPTKGP